ncbi:MAG: MFS transporter [Moorea sp. SIOASIH]|uniref:MFS transporter n=1 Tax=Moorena sp. SIOASIH TaxID=2607817 RepID=UPI0013BE58E5|nr:MFS transporter [Moorena sp. SIOASIH]NEO40951.1 MFS transporter [Moorena sp. SIOASIH]
MKAQDNKRGLMLVLCASVFIDYISYGIVIPLLPFYAQSFGASPMVIGLLVSVFLFMQLFASPVWGSLSDRIGRRPALLLNIAGSGLSCLWFGLANSLWMLFGARALAGASSSSITIAQSYITDITTPENRTSSLGFLEAATGFGYLLGPAIGGLLVGADPDNLNFRLPGFAAAGVSLLTLCFAVIALPSLRRPKSLGTVETSWEPQRLLMSGIEVLRRPLLGTLIGIVFLAMFAGKSSMAIFPLWCEHQFGWGPREYGYLIIFCCMLGVTTQIGLIRPLTRWFPEAKLLIWGLISMGVGLLLISFSTSLPLLLGAMVFATCGQAVANPANISLISQLAGAKQQGKTLGVGKSIRSLASLTGAIWGGFVFEALGPNWPYWIGGFLMLGVAAFSWSQITNSRLSTVAHKRRQRKLIYLFNILDFDKNGVIELADFEQAVENIAQVRGWKPGSKDYEFLYFSWISFGEWLQDLVDLNGNGQIELSEWLECLDKRLDYDFSEAFIKLIDGNEDGKIVREELRLFYQAYQIDTTHIEEAFETLDLNRDNSISKEEFKQIFDQFLYSEDVQAPGNWFLGVSLAKQL